MEQGIKEARNRLDDAMNEMANVDTVDAMDVEGEAAQALANAAYELYSAAGALADYLRQIEKGES